jgi:hypothetical protein
MDYKDHLLLQLRGDLRDLDEAERVLENRALDAGLRERVRAPFTREFKRRRDALKHQEQELTSGETALLDTWRDFRQTHADCGALYRECLALTVGALNRAAGLDGGLCAIADALLDDLGRRLADIKWGRFTLLAEGEFFADLAGIIRLQFPANVWNLPVAVHEFGHFLGPRLEDHVPGGLSQHPFQDMLTSEQSVGTLPAGYLHEHFADLFAIYALGPAFACNCLLLRFDPAVDDGRTHPGAAKRAYVILRALDALGRAANKNRPPFASVARQLDDWWKKTMASAAPSLVLQPEQLLQLDNWVDQLFDLLEGLTPALRYGEQDWLRAQRLNAELRPDGNPLALQAGDRLADVLNAGWLYRLDNLGAADYPLDRIGEKMVMACQKIMG